MDEQQHIATIRESWIRWLTNATDKQIVTFHESARAFIEEDKATQAALMASDGIMPRSFSAYQPEHGDGYYGKVNEWLQGRGFEAEPAQVIDTLDLPPDVRQRAERAESLPSA